MGETVLTAMWGIAFVIVVIVFEVSRFGRRMRERRRRRAAQMREGDL